MPKTAISFMIPTSPWNDFKKRTDELFLARAPFLDYMIRRELPYLRDDMAGQVLSTRAKRYISGRLKHAGAKSVNIEVSTETAEELRAVVAEHNMVRDAFMCRLVLFLRATDAFLDYLEVPRQATGEAVRGLEDMPTSPLGAMEAVRDDPLFYIRNHLARTWEQGVYRVRLPRKWDLAACYLDDDEVPGTRANRKRQKEEDEAFGMPSAPGKLASERVTATRNESTKGTK